MATVADPRELRHELASLEPGQVERVVETLNDAEVESLLHDWGVWARDEQLEPPGDWRFWYVMAGRGYGKTRTGAETICRWAHDFGWLSLVAPTSDDAREIMIEGESGILAVSPRWWRPYFNQSKRRLTWPNGARATYYTADEPERLRGKQHQRAWLEEPGSWRYPSAWDQFLLGLRLPPDPRAIITGTPRPMRIVRELVADPEAVITKGTTYENLDNLAPHVARIFMRFEGTKTGRQELLAELLEDDEEAIIPRSWLDQRACSPDAPTTPEKPAVLGVDVGAGGDDCCVVLRAGPVARILKRWQERDTMATASEVAAFAKRYGVTAINVDEIGVGAGVRDDLKRRQREGQIRAKVNGVAVSSRASDPARYENLRAELWWEVGRRLTEEGGWNLRGVDTETLDELSAPHFRLSSSGRVMVEPKDKVKERIGRSPDAADALLLAFYQPQRGSTVWSF